MPVKKRCEVQVWRASPNDVDHAQWRALTRSLGLLERSKAFDLRVEADRKAYVLVHGLRRLALSLMLDVAPETLVFRDNDKGQPQLVKPKTGRIYFSHSHTREHVLFAASSDAAVGVDAESVAADPVDFTLLRPFLVLPVYGSTEAATFYKYWTALEAFWKAAGTGLSCDHPRLCLSSPPLGHWNVAFEAPRGSGLTALATHAVILPVTSPLNCVASLAIIRPFASGNDTVVVHEKEFMKDKELSRLFFMAGSAASSASRTPNQSPNPFVKPFV